MKTYTKSIVVILYGSLLVRVIVFEQWVLVSLLVGVPILIILVIAYRAKLRCPKCDMTMALRKTGKKENRGGRFYHKWYEEWECKHCGYSKWMAKPPPVVS